MKEKNLEYRIKDFRERTIGRELAERYPFDFEECTAKHNVTSGFDAIKLYLKFLGKLVVPYKGDKLMMEWVKLESELNPKRRHQFCFCGGGFIGGKYALLGTSLVHSIMRINDVVKYIQNLY